MTAQVDMLYYLDLGGGSIMAACYEESDIQTLGQDYYVVHVGDAEIYNTVGELCAFGDIPRGCPLRIEWPGMIMESYPGQISATRVTALEDEPDPRVPPEDEIPAINGGVKWWVSEPVTELPSLTMEYTTPDYATAVFLQGNGSWNYQTGAGHSAGVVSCGENPVDWDYDDNNTCKRVGYDTVRFITNPAYGEISVQAYVDGSTEPQDVPVDEDGTLVLVDGQEVIYVIHLMWNTPDYWGEGDYGVKLVTP